MKILELTREYFMPVALTLLFFTIVVVSFMAAADYIDAKNQCRPLIENNDCSYEKCMVREYGSNQQVSNVVKCEIIRDSEGVSK